MDLGLSGRTALVCASTGGIGEAIARALAEEGANTVVCGRRGRRAREIAATLPKAIGVEVDLLGENGVTDLLAATVEAFGPPDVLVLNGPGPKQALAAALDLGDVDVALDAMLRRYILKSLRDLGFEGA